MIVCLTCGATALPSAPQCSNCGADLPATISNRPPSDGQTRRAQTGTFPGAGSQPIIPAGTLLNGRYRVVRVLGTGAFGRVYLAEDHDDPNNAPLAIKELLAMEFNSADEQRDAISWFKREVSTLLTLEHPGIPAIHGYWTAHRTAGPLYLAMDYIPGKTLAEHQAQVGRLPWPQVVAWAIALCDVLGYLHSRVPPFVFRDVKPANVLIDNRSGAPVLIDFGLARQLVPLNGTAIGTWGYVPFEQVLGKAEPRSDLYSLGAMLHELLTGNHPDVEYRRLLRGGLDVEGALRSLFPPVDTLVSGLPPELGRLLSHATAFPLEDRFANAASMSNALQRLLAGVDQVGSPPSAPPAAPPSAPLFSDPPPRAAGGAATVSTPPDPPTMVIPSIAAPTAYLSRPSEPRDDAPPVGPSATPQGQPSLAAGPPSTPPLPTPRTPTIAFSVPPAPPTQYVALPGPTVPDISPAPTPAIQDLAQGNGAVLSPYSRAPLPLVTPLPESAPPNIAPILPSGISLPPGFGSGGQPAQPPSTPLGAPRKGRWWLRSSSTPSEVLRTVRVGPGAGVHYRTISEALRRVEDGTRIEVEPGVYPGGLVLARHVEIVSVGPIEETIIQSDDAACILMHAERAAVRGLTLQCRAGLGENRFYAVNVPAGRLLLEDCIVSSGSLAAVAIHGSSAAPTIRRCAIHNDGERGLAIYSGSSALIEGCDIFGNTVGVRISGRATPILRRCRIHNGKLGGVAVSEHGEGLFEDCEILDNGHHGVTVRQGSNPVFRRCRIARNGWSAVSVADTSGAVVESCDLTGNKGGPWDVKESAKLRVKRRDNREV